MIAILKVLVCGSLAAAAASKSVEQCPVAALKSADVCFGLVSQCWSPGENDVDCPANGVCCFDGCVNVCGFPPLPANEVPQPCTTGYVNQTEEVPEEVCTDVPGMETCTTVNTSECEQVCEFVDQPETVTEVKTCCRTTKRLSCEEAPCDPEGGTSEEVPYEEITCKKRERVCYNVPEKVCRDEEAEVCEDAPRKKCVVVKKPVEWPATLQECSTEYVEKCKVVHREICNDYIGHLNPKLHHILFKGKGPLSKKRRVNNPICYTAPSKVCSRQPYMDCKDVTKITVEYEDVEECHEVTENVCKLKVIPKCEYVDREHCNEAENVCETNSTFQTIFVKNNCHFVGKECHFEDVEECEDHEEHVEKVLPKKVCRHVCEPSTKSECKRDPPNRDCRTTFKTMTYRVPVRQCQDFNSV